MSLQFKKCCFRNADGDCIEAAYVPASYIKSIQSTCSSVFDAAANADAIAVRDSKDKSDQPNTLLFATESWSELLSAVKARDFEQKMTEAVRTDRTFNTGDISLVLMTDHALLSCRHNGCHKPALKFNYAELAAFTLGVLNNEFSILALQAVYVIG